MTTEPTAARASTEEWCERSDEGHSWSYTHHAGLPRVETRTCVLCQFLSVEPVRELLRAAPAGTGSPTPADDPRTCDCEDCAAVFVRLTAERDEARLAHDNAKWMIDGQHQEIEYLRNRTEKPGCAQAHEDLATVEAERDAARAELSQVQRERDALKLAAGLTADTVVSFAVGAIRNMLDTAHVARTQLRPQIARLEADLADARRDLAAARDRLDANGVIPDRYDEAIRERDEARSALAALRAEVDKIADDMHDDRQGLTNAHECSTCNGARVVKCAAHIAGDGCEDLALPCPDCTDQSPAAPPKVVVLDIAGGYVRNQEFSVPLEDDERAGQSPTSDTQTDSGGS